MESVIANPTDDLRPGASSRSRGKVVLQVDSLRKHYGSNEAVAGVSFDLRQGEVFGLHPVGTRCFWATVSETNGG
jgi:ABC-type uncharacterized transport system ATPase subunit